MALIIGLDIGSYSIRIVKLKYRIQKVELYSAEEYILWGQAKQDELIRQILTEHCQGADIINTQLTGDKISLRKLKLPKAAFKNIEQILPFELEGLIPFETNNSIIDWQMGYGETDGEKNILAGASLINTVQEEINFLNNCGIVPAQILAGPLVLGELINYINITDYAFKDKTVAILDIGHKRSDICIIENGISITARTISKGMGLIDKAVSDHYKISIDQAVQFKHTKLNLTTNVFDTELRGVVDSALNGLIREIKQTLSNHIENGGTKVDLLILTGGGSRVKGIAEYLAQILNISVRFMNISLPVYPYIKREETTFFGAALGAALAGVRKKTKKIDFRKGEFALIKSSSHIAKTLGLGTIYIIIIFIAFMFSLYSKYYSLSKENETQTEQLKTITQRITGKSIESFSEVKLLINAKKADDKSPVPQYDAFDIIEEMSKLIPPEINHEIESLNVRQGRIEMVGKFDKLGEETKIAEALRGWTDCFKNVQVTRTTELARESRTKYTIDIETNCP